MAARTDGGMGDFSGHYYIQFRPRGGSSSQNDRAKEVVHRTSDSNPEWSNHPLQKPREITWIDQAKGGEYRRAFQFPCRDLNHAQHLIYALLAAQSVARATYTPSTFSSHPYFSFFTPDGSPLPDTYTTIF